MSDLKADNLNSLTKIVETPRSAYAEKSLDERALPTPQGKALALTVVSVNHADVVLKAPNSKQAITVSKDAILGLDSQQSLKAGDKLILLSSTAKSLNFHIEQSQSMHVKQMSAPLIQSLSKHWPDISISTLKKALPNLLSQVSLPTTSPLSSKLLSSIVDIAQKTGEPIFSATLNAKVSVLTSNNITLSLTIAHMSKTSQLSLPMPLELQGKVHTDDTVKLTLDANMTKGAIKSLSVNNDISLPQSALRSINQYLHQRPASIKPILNNVFLHEQINKPQNATVLDTSSTTLNKLGKDISSKLLGQLSPSMLEEAKIAISASPTINKGQASSNANQLQIMLLAKPVILNIERTSLEKLPELKLNTNGKSSQFSPSGQIDPNSKVSNTKETITNLLQTKFVSNIGQDQVSELKIKLANELNQSLARSSSVSEGMFGVTKILDKITTSGSPDLKAFIKSIAVSQHPDEAKANKSDVLTDSDLRKQSNISVDDLKQIFNTAALPDVSMLKTPNVQGAVPSGSFLNGLVTMLQASLLAKLANQQPQLANQINALLPTLAKAVVPKQGQQNVKTLQELHRRDPNSELISQVNKVLSNHTLHKLSGSESTLQGQDTFYYALPNMFSPQAKDTEILIKREQQNESGKDEGESQTHWQLSLKLDVGNQGQALAKVKLIEEKLDLHIYASNEALKTNIVNMLPHLEKRLEHLGLRMNHKCFLGKIPETLHKTNFQMVQAYV